MRRGGASWAGPARRVRFVPGLLTLALTLPLAAAAVGCAGPGEETGGPGTSAPASASRTAQPPLTGEELCTSAVNYWAREMLAGATPYGDYQSMGLSNRQYDILRDVVNAARAAGRAQGPSAADQLIDRRVRASCTAAHRDGGPTEGPWR
ncbi:hypothetical protein ACFXAS_10545 [Streptomyces sp. NPDC059459]|uniref:hypothetical protein n=1 Tax=Streptomyces sp. NPDC059459 TaxID=3346839 RepID=UPI00367DC0B1